MADSLLSNPKQGVNIVLHRDPVSEGKQPRDMPGTLYVFENGNYIGSTRANENGYQIVNGEQKHGIYSGDYYIRGRTDEDSTSDYKNGTPAVMAPGETNPGNAGHGFQYVFIHPKSKSAQPDSKGCVTVSPEWAIKIKDLMDRHPNDTALHVYFDKKDIPSAKPVEHTDGVKQGSENVKTSLMKLFSRLFLFVLFISLTSCSTTPHPPFKPSIGNTIYQGWCRKALAHPSANSAYRQFYDAYQGDPEALHKYFQECLHLVSVWAIYADPLENMGCTMETLLCRLGDARFAAALEKETPKTQRAVREMFDDSFLKDYPITQKLLDSAPHIDFPLNKVERDDLTPAERKKVREQKP